MPNAEQKQSPNSRAVHRNELPMHCPTPGSDLWNSHPRVFIPLDDAADGRASCPYCGTEFYLVEE